MRLENGGLRDTGYIGPEGHRIVVSRKDTSYLYRVSSVTDCFINGH